MQSLLPNVVSKEVFPEVAAIAASTAQFAFIIGPAIGGILYSLSPEAVYIVAEY